MHFDHRVPYTNDDNDYPFDGRDMAEMEAELAAEKKEEEDVPF